ncbi:MAG: hypothetical protein NTW74_07515 [Acidobacteria bacterium]|nr:hypothetical protein [Acidobacteriota bacterium]
MKKLISIAILGTGLVFAQAKRTTPPTIARVSPLGIARGMTVEMEVEGFNLAKASAIYFSEKGITGKILRIKELPDQAEVRLGASGGASSIELGQIPARNQVTVEIDISTEAKIGPVNFRILTPLGTSPVGTFLVEPFYGEAADMEPNDSVDNAAEVYLPAIFTGAISRNGDVDTYKIKARAGQQVVFENGATMLGSSLQPIVRILREDQSVAAEFGQDGGESVRLFAHRFDKEGTYYVQISDFQQSGRASHIYRLKAGDFSVITGVYPLGVQKGKTANVTLEGINFAESKIAVKGEPSDRDAFAVMLRPGKAFNDVRLELGQHPEVEGVDKLSFPLTVNGKLSDTARYRFNARRGEELVFEIDARRAGSDMDSFLEVLDMQGKSIERAVVRPVWETTTTLRDHDSATRGIRINSWNALKVGDYVMLGGEVLKINAMPRGPDDDMIFENFNGQRITYLDTTAEAHAIDKSIYKAQIFPAGSKFTPNGLPLLRLYFRNDDGGPGYGKDSLLHFTAPADGEYQLVLRDVRGKLAKPQAYRLTARHSEPDFRISMNPRNPTVPLGGAIPVTMQAFRMDGFDGPISVNFDGLPPGITATPTVIPPGQIFATVLLKSDGKPQSSAFPIQVSGRYGDKVRYANQEDNLKLVSVMPQADITMTAITKVVELEAGSTADVNLSITRNNGFEGRVPVQVMNLPPSVRVLDVGLNGVLLNEDETKRGFTLAALPDSEPLEQVIYIGGTIETRSPQQTIYAAPEAILLRIKSNKGPQITGSLVTGGNR